MLSNNKEIEKIKMSIHECKRKIENLNKECKNNSTYLTKKDFPFIVYEERHHI